MFSKRQVPPPTFCSMNSSSRRFLFSFSSVLSLGEKWGRSAWAEVRESRGTPVPAAGTAPASGLAHAQLLLPRFRLGTSESQLLRGLVVVVLVQRLRGSAAAGLREQQAVLRLLLLRGRLLLVHHRLRRRGDTRRAWPELHHCQRKGGCLTLDPEAAASCARRVLSTPPVGSEATKRAEADAKKVVGLQRGCDLGTV